MLSCTYTLRHKISRRSGAATLDGLMFDDGDDDEEDEPIKARLHRCDDSALRHSIESRREESGKSLCLTGWRANTRRASFR